MVSLGEFAQALLDPHAPAPAGLPDRGFNVYRNNVIAGLIGALKESYPQVVRIVGDEFFTAMARGFARRHPPRVPMMFAYGGEFPDFIDEFEPACELAYLSGVARIEWAWIEAYHAPDATPLDPAIVCADSVLDLHPSLRIVTSEFPILTIWADGEIADCGQDVLIVRPHWNVQVNLLPPGGAVLLRALESGYSLAAATEMAGATGVALDLEAILALLFRAGAFTCAR